MKFFGRERQLEDLKGLWGKRVSSLCTCRGRRRIGKSTLIEQFAKISNARFIKIEGVRPKDGYTNEDELSAFAVQLAAQTGSERTTPENWLSAFIRLDKEIRDDEKTVVLIDEISWFVSEQGNPVTIKSPSDDEITSEQTTYITQQFNTMERNWRQYLYLPTFLRHFLVGELSGNTDTYWSTYMYKHRDDPLFYTGPVWDFDIAFDNDYRTYPINSNGDYIYRTTGSCAGNMRYFVNRIINDEAVQKQLLAVWDSVRQAGLTESMIDEYITQMATKLDQSQQLNFMRWPILNNFVHLNPMVWGSYEAEVDNVRRFMRERIEWMDNKLGYEYVPNAISTITSSTDNSQQVYSLQGVSYGSSLETLPAGVYIVKQGQTIKKIRKK